MQETADEINDELGGDESDNYGEGSDVILNGLLSEFPPKIESKGQIDTLDGTLSIRVVVLPQVLFLIDFIAIGDGRVGGWGHEIIFIKLSNNMTIYNFIL